MGEPQDRVWLCTVCQYEHVGPAPPDVCPVCGAGAEVFVLKNGDDGDDAPAEDELQWHRVASLETLADGEVTTVEVDGHAIALCHCGDRYGALDDACPHQGGPLGQGTIVDGRLRCPWHGWDFDPHTGKGHGVASDTTAYPAETRDDGVYVGLAAAPPPARTVCDVMAETMVRWGISHVFGMVGHSNLGMADALRRREEAGELTYIGIRHEGAASFAASAYGKLTGKPAACMAIAGPGSTNMLTGLWDAKMDRVPILALTGQVDTQVLGPGAFQEVDLASAFSSVAAWSQTVLDGSKHGELVTLALKHAVMRRDVAHLILPNEVQSLPAPEGAEASGPEGRITPQNITPPAQAIDEAAALLRKARRPAIIVGHGARFSMPAVMALAELLRCPVITTFKGKGLIADSHPLACGVLGRSGTAIASHFMNEADLLVVFGATFSTHTGIDPHTPTIQVDFDPLVLGKFHPVEVPVYGEIGITARLLHDELVSVAAGYADHRAEIAGCWERWRTEKAKRASEDRGQGMASAALFAALSEVTPANAVIAVDVGHNTYSFGRYFECQEQSILMSGYLGSIGFGYPAAMGAWAAAPDRPIVAITGDGGFAQYMGELCTAVKYGMTITHVLLNNRELAKISTEQRAARMAVWQTSLHNPDFAKYAEICGALGIRVTDRKALDAALRRAFAHDGPALVEVLTDPELV